MTTERELKEQGYTYRVIYSINNEPYTNHIVKGSRYMAKKAANRYLSNIMADGFVTANYGTDAVYSYTIKKLK